MNGNSVGNQLHADRFARCDKKMYSFKNLSSTLFNLLVALKFECISLNGIQNRAYQFYIMRVCSGYLETVKFFPG